MITTSPEMVGLSTSRLDRINELTAGYINRGDVPGTVTLVARRGEIAHFQTSGLMSFETEKPMVEDGIFRIYSMTKPVTSVAAMILYERGYFQLNTPVSKFIPEFKNLQVYESGTVDDYKTVKPGREMNVGDLLKHTSGLTYEFLDRTVVGQIYQRNQISIYSQNHTLQDFVQKIAQLPLLFSPGANWNYSISTEVLGYVIEVISGKTLDVFIKEEIMDPLGMVDTHFFLPTDKQDRLTTQYIHKSRMPEEVTQQNPTAKLFPTNDKKVGLLAQSVDLVKGGQGLFSTASDYLKFATMLLNQGRIGHDFLLSPKTVQLMTTNHLDGDLQSCCVHKIGSTTPAGVGFGLGFSVMMDPTKAGILGTPGEFHWTGGAHTSFFVDPKEDMVAILLTQVFPPGLYNIDKEFRVAVYQSLMDTKC